jgi:ribosome-associated protein
MGHEPDILVLPNGVRIETSALQFRFSRSSGPGGQHVNKTSTRVTLEFDVAASNALTAEQKHRITRRLASRMNDTGVLQLSCSEYRSQAANRRAVVQRFVDLLSTVLTVQKRRRPTRIPARVRAERLAVKRRRSDTKRLRRRVGRDE